MRESMSSYNTSMVLAATSVVILALGDVSRTQTGAIECTVSAIQQKAPAGTTITAAAVVEASGKVPRHCRVDGSVTTPGNAVNFRLGLPTNWNGKFLFHGGAGFGGSIVPIDPGL